MFDLVSHGDFDEKSMLWFCGYWMNKDEWISIHNYNPDNYSSDVEIIDE